MFESRSTQLVFAYGSNMHEKDLSGWLERGGYAGVSVEEAGVATLEGYRLVWNHFDPGRRGGAANVEPGEGSEVPGLLLRVDAAGLAALDAKEEHPWCYRRELLPLRSRDGAASRGKTYEAWVYVVTPEQRSGVPVPPTRAYLNLLIESAQRFGLPHLAELEATETRD